MALEIEVKYRVSGHDRFRNALRSLGAVFAGRFVETDSIYDTPDQRLFRADCGLRLRMSDEDSSPSPAARLTFKGPVTDSLHKTREELEVEVNDAVTSDAILVALGFDIQLRYKKKRERWRVGECGVELDEMPLLGFFLEIEGGSAAAIDHLAVQLGLSESDRVPQTYVSLLLDECRLRGLDPKSVDFAREARP